MKKKILITGGNGYIGRHLIKKLLKRDDQITAFVRDLGKMPGWLLGTEKLEVIEGDLADKLSLKKAVKETSVVFHLAAALRIFEQNNELYQTNIVGLKNILSACKKANQPIQFVFASTIDVEARKKTDYSQSKLEGEKIVKKFCQANSRLSFVIVRIGNVYDGKEGVIKGIEGIINRQNWQASILCHTLAEKPLYLIKMKNLIDKLEKIVVDPKVKGKTLTLVDEKLTMQKLAARLKKQKLIGRISPQIPLDGFILKLWRILGRILRRGDLLVYLSLADD